MEFKLVRLILVSFGLPPCLSGCPQQSSQSQRRRSRGSRRKLLLQRNCFLVVAHCCHGCGSSACFTSANDFLTQKRPESSKDVREIYSYFYFPYYFEFFLLCSGPFSGDLPVFPRPLPTAFAELCNSQPDPLAACQFIFYFHIIAIYFFLLFRPMEVYHRHCHRNGCVCHVVFTLPNALAGLGLSRNRLACSFASKHIAMVVIAFRHTISYQEQAGLGDAAAQAVPLSRFYLFRLIA